MSPQLQAAADFGSHLLRRAERTARDVKTVAELAPVQRRVVKAGEVLFSAGQPLANVYLVSAGIFKSTSISVDGREKIVGFHPKGFWLGFDALADGQHACEMVALDTSEVMSIAYEQLLQACTKQPQLLRLVHESMSREQARHRESLMSISTLSADARVADFLFGWADSLAACGLRNDQIRLRMTRAEIASYLGLALESVSRALSRLVQHDLIRFDEASRRDIRIPRVDALAAFVQQSAGAVAVVH
jgi:CRP/FNR family transcriptional regulator